MSLMTIQLLRNLRASWSRIALMVIAITVSLSVFGTMLYAWAVIAREVTNAYMGTEPASATILLDRPIDVAQMATIAAQVETRTGVIAAAGRTQFTGEVSVDGRLLDLPLQVFVAAPDDALRVARFQVQPGQWPPAAGEVFIARDSLSLLGVEIGDSLTVALPNGDSLPLRVAATVYDPSLSPSAQEQTGRAYLSTASLAASGVAAQLDQLKIEIADAGQTVPSRDRAAIVAVAGDVGEWLQREHSLAIRELQVPEPYTHPHQWQADSVVGALLAGGAAAVLLSTILVANMLNGLFTQQIPQIGIMKAIGARSRVIGRLYLAMTLTVAGMATALALPIAILGGRAFAGQLFGFLGLEVTSLEAPWWTYALILVVGLGLPPLLALVPLVRTARTTVRAAIDHHGGGSKPSAASDALARLSRSSRLDRSVLMALRNTVRRPARFLLAVGLLATAGTAFVAGMSLSSGIAAVEEEQTAQRTWDVDVQLADPVAIDDVAVALERAPGIGQVDSRLVVPVGLAGPGEIPVTRTYPDQGHGRVVLTAMPATTPSTTPTLLEGRWLSPGETDSVVLNQVARNTVVPGLGAGDSVQLLIAGRPTTWQIVGIVEERAAGSVVYATREGLAAATGQPEQVNLLRIATVGHDEPDRAAAADEIDERLSAAGIDVAAAESVGRAETASQGHLRPLVLIVLGIAIAMGVIGIIGLASTVSANVLDRTREFGVLSAVGARSRTVRRIVTLEGVFLAIASCLAAIVPALALTAVLGAALGSLFLSAPLPYRISPIGAGIWIAFVVLGAILATEAAATRASRLTVREALAYL